MTREPFWILPPAPILRMGGGVRLRQISVACEPAQGIGWDLRMCDQNGKIIRGNWTFTQRGAEWSARRMIRKHGGTGYFYAATGRPVKPEDCRASR